LALTSGFREVFAKQKFGKIQQEFSSKSLLNEGERSERLQAVPLSFVVFRNINILSNDILFL